MDGCVLHIAKKETTQCCLTELGQKMEYNSRNKILGASAANDQILASLVFQREPRPNLTDLTSGVTLCFA